MSLRIKTKKIVERGIKYIKVTKISSLMEGELPVEYTNGESVFCVKKPVYLLHYKEDIGMLPIGGFLVIGGLYTEKIFADKMTIIRRCGNHLMEINKVLGKENKDWEGQETHIV